jgi:uracil-DNA glycosylase family 4
MNRRELILRELGLTPLWVRRGQDGPEASARLEAPMAATAAIAQAPPQSAEERAQLIARMDWPALKEAVRGCTACPLHAARLQAVFGVGDEQADWLFVGEGPGAEEDARGEPFVGQAGRLLDNMLASIGLQRGRDVYIANVVKCRPPGNRVPEPAEARQCEPFLLRQIELIEPKLIVALGKTAASNLLHTEASLGSLRGRLHEFRGTPVLVTYHPAYLLRSLPDKAKAWEDLCLAADTMRGLKAKDSARS